VGEADAALRGRLAILHPPGRMALIRNPFGKDVANLQLWRALARHGGYERIDVLSVSPADPGELAKDLFEGAPGATAIGSGGFQQAHAAVSAGVLMRGAPHISDLAWLRRRAASDRAYSLVGMIHTLAPPAIRQQLAAVLAAPTHPWDALICTSPAVREGMERLFDAWGAHLADRTGGRAPPRVRLPVIPLGVDAADLAGQADRGDARARMRAELGLAEGDVLVLWVGRLSYFEKAFPQPMFMAVQQAQAATGVRAVFAMAGWFPSDGDRALYEDAVRAHAPDVAIRFVDGNDRARLADLWAAGDIFLSLVDNVQETFGITPLEAMAAGLPVVASDWDGYRATVRDGVEGFLIPTLIGSASGGVGAALADSHAIEAMSYQAYVGAVAQHSAVHIGRAAEALAALMRAPDLRRRMGDAGRARVQAHYDWPVVARQIHALTQHLAEVRAAGADPQARIALDPARGDPFRDFAHFATNALTHDTPLRATPGMTPDLVRAAGVASPLDSLFGAMRADPELCADALAVLQARDGATVREVLLAFPPGQRRGVEMGLAWMAKYGFVDWLT
jgi:glycosyltransferase involved in cell wall biosynthesis